MSLHNIADKSSIPGVRDVNLDEFTYMLGSSTITKQYTKKRKRSERMKKLLYPSTYSSNHLATSVKRSLKMVKGGNISIHWIERVGISYSRIPGDPCLFV